MLVSLSYALLRYRTLSMRVPGRLDDPCASTASFSKGLQSRNPKKSEQVARSHVARVRHVPERNAQLLG